VRRQASIREGWSLRFQSFAILLSESSVRKKNELADRSILASQDIPLSLRGNVRCWGLAPTPHTLDNWPQALSEALKPLREQAGIRSATVYADMNADHSQHYTVKEAAELLGITPEAVRARLFRGTLQRETGDDGTVYVVLRTQPNDDQSHDQSTTQGLMLERLDSQLEDMREQVAFLRLELDHRTEEIRRRDTIIAQLTQRIPELPAPEEHHGGSSDEPGARETATERESRGDDDAPPLRQGPTKPRSLWRRIFGV